jgi:hypothetical protein
MLLRSSADKVPTTQGYHLDLGVESFTAVISLGLALSGQTGMEM